MSKLSASLDPESQIVEPSTICPKDVLIAKLTKRIEEQDAYILKLEARLEELEQVVETLKRQLFGKKSEKPHLPAPDQMVLGLQGEGEPEYEEEEAALPADKAVAPPAAKPRGGSKKGRKIRALNLPDDFPTETHRILPKEVLANPAGYREIGEPERREMLDRGHAQWRRLIIERPTFVSIEEPHKAPITAPAEPEMILGGYLSASLLVSLIIFKFAYHHPLYRFARMAKAETGVELSESTLCQAVRRCSEMVSAVVQQMRLEMWASGYVQYDLTPVLCLGKEGDKAGADGSFFGQMWYTGVPRGDLIVTWNKSKEAICLHDIIPSNYTGYIQCDGGGEITSFVTGGKASQLPDGKPTLHDLKKIYLLACWAHVRRKFYDSGRSKCPESNRLVALIGKLYAIEKEAREAPDGPLAAPARKALRDARAPEILSEIKATLDRLNPDTNEKVRPTTPLGKAVKYTLNQWERLQVYLQDGRLEIDNNLIENAIRPCAIGKKNYLFIGHVKAGDRAANFYSLIGSCLNRGLSPTAYLTWLFERLPRTPRTSANMSTLTPKAYAALIAANTPVPQPTLGPVQREGRAAA